MMPKTLQLHLRLLQLHHNGVEVSIQQHPGAEKLSQEEKASQILNLLDKLEQVK
jgi:hypothetical protein